MKPILLRLVLATLFGVGALLFSLVFLGLSLGDPPAGPDGVRHKDMSLALPAAVACLACCWGVVTNAIAIPFPPPSTRGGRYERPTVAIGLAIFGFAALAWAVATLDHAGIGLLVGVTMGPPLAVIGVRRWLAARYPR